MRRSGLRVVVILVLVVGMAGCVTGGTTAPATPASPSLTSPPAATQLSIPVQTPTQEPSPAPTATSVPSPTPLPTRAAPPMPVPMPTPDGTERSVTVPILMYHRIADLPDDASQSQRDYMVTPASLEEQLRHLRDNGYQSISLYALIGNLRRGDPLPDKPVILTFDDGYRDNAVTAFPLLVEYGFTATFFIITQTIDHEYPAYMTWAQVEHISGQGMDVEAHSHTHPNLRGMSADDVAREVRLSKEAIERHTGKTVRFFSYPFGHYDQQVVDILVSQDFWGAVTLRAGTTQASGSVFDLVRTWVRGDDTLESFAAKLNRGW